MQKTLDTKWARIKNKTVNTFSIKIIPVHHQIVSCVMGCLVVKTIQVLVEKFACPLRGVLK